MATDHPSPKNVNAQLKDRLVVRSKSLVRSGHGLTLAESRILLLANSKIWARDPVPDFGQSPRIFVSAKDLADVFSVSSSTAYGELQDFACHIRDREGRGFAPDHLRKGEPLVTSGFKWTQAANYIWGEGRVELEFGPRVVPHLYNQERNFVAYRLGMVSQLAMVSSLRIFEHLAIFPKTGWAKFTVKDLAIALDFPASAFDDFGVARRVIFEPAIKELNSVLDLGLTCRYARSGRRIVEVHFTYRNPLFPVCG